MFVRNTSVGRLAGLVVTAAVVGTLLIAAPASAQPATGFEATAVTGVSTGHHAGFDRLVFSFAQSVPAFDVRYVDQVTEDASGRPVPLLGSAFLLVVFHGASVRSPIGTLTPKLPMLKQVKPAGNFEAVVSFGVGLASRSGFRTFTLRGPARLVIDLAIPTSSTGATSGTASPPSNGSGVTSSSGSTGSNSPSELPNTGSNLVPLAIGGAGLVGLGALGRWLSRRRRMAC